MHPSQQSWLTSIEYQSKLKSFYIKAYCGKIFYRLIRSYITWFHWNITSSFIADISNFRPADVSNSVWLKSLDLWHPQSRANSLHNMIFLWFVTKSSWIKMPEKKGSACSWQIEALMGYILIYFMVELILSVTFLLLYYMNCSQISLALKAISNVYVCNSNREDFEF